MSTEPPTAAEMLVLYDLRACLQAESHWLLVHSPQGTGIVTDLLIDTLPESVRYGCAAYVLPRFPAAVIAIPKAELPPTILAAWIATHLHYPIAPEKMAGCTVVGMGREEPVTRLLAWLGDVTEDQVRAVQSGDVMDWEIL